MIKDNSDKCEVCGKGLVYAKSIDDYKVLKCEFCQKEFEANTYCPHGHYICDSCHSKGPIQVLEDFALNTSLKDPFDIARISMQHPKFKVYGPEHHILVPVALLTALKNNNISKPNGEEISELDIKTAIKRASKIPGGWCGFYGSCGAGMGSGVFISIFTGATPGNNIPRSLANKMTSRSLFEISDNLEHCCKRSVRISIREALKFLKEEFNINLDYKPEKCTFSDSNDKCELEKCYFYR